MQGKSEQCEKEISNLELEKEDLLTDSDKILSDDFGSLYVSDEKFFELMKVMTTSLKELSR